MIADHNAVDLIDAMLVVPPEKRYTIDQCLAHPWLTAKLPGVNDSTDGLVGGVAGLEVNRRGVVRERTLLSSINTVQVTNRVPMGDKQEPMKIYTKNPKTAKPGATTMLPRGGKEAGPADQRNQEEFMELGGKGDQVLFGNDGDSHYPTADIAQSQVSDKTKQKGKGGQKPNGR
jgi:serine/threonine-protein kinase CHEK2